MSTADREREQYEALVAAYRQLPRAEPPPERDRAVLAAARAAVVGERAPRSRWPALVGTAATLALAVGLAWQVRQQDVRAPSGGGEGTAMPTVESPTSTVGAAPSAPGAVAEPAAAPKRQDRAQEALRKKSARQDETIPVPQEKAAGEVESVAIEAPPPPPPPAPSVAKPELRDAPAAAAPALEERKARPAEPPRPAAAAGTPASEADAAQPFPQDARAPAPDQPPLAPSAPPAPHAAAPAGAGLGVTEPAPAKAAVDSVRRERADDQAPAAWLEEIRRLLRQGQRERAVDELEAFKSAFPETPLPEDLRDLAP